MSKTISNGIQRTLEVRPNALTMTTTNNYKELVMFTGKDDRKAILEALAEEWSTEFGQVIEEYSERFKKSYYKLPENLAFNSEHAYLNYESDEDGGFPRAFVSDSFEDSYGSVQTRFTEVEFNAVVKAFPEFSVMIKEDI